MEMIRRLWRLSNWGLASVDGFIMRVDVGKHKWNAMINQMFTKQPMYEGFVIQVGDGGVSNPMETGGGPS